MCHRFPFLILIPTSPLPKGEKGRKENNLDFLGPFNTSVFFKAIYLVSCQIPCSNGLKHYSQEKPLVMSLKGETTIKVKPVTFAFHLI